jgi:hypothetical protein
MRDLRDRIGELSLGLDRLATELDGAETGMSERDRFKVDHAPDSAFLGPIPTDLDHRAIWSRGAAVLERHHLGLNLFD